MPRDTLVDVFRDLAAAPGVFLVRDDGYRSWSYSYADVAAAAEGFAARLHEAGLAKGETVLFWSENRPEWIAAFWGCILSGIVVVPIDFRSPREFVERVAGVVNARLLLAGAEVDPAGAQLGGGASQGQFHTWPLADLDWRDVRKLQPSVPIASGDVAEIIFTSGATAEPKGVVITHANVLANLVPVEREIEKYRWLGRPFFPLRFLNLLPLSHMFGQALSTFIPPALPGTVVFVQGQNPAAIQEQVRRRRISVIVAVPKILEVLRAHVVARYPDTALPLPRPVHVARRWWRYRRIHRDFGPKFWSFVVGAAPLDAGVEEFWGRLGFLVIQGYGLTEAAPVVSLNHPFAARRGSVGKPIAGVEVQIAADGEILVRGPNVTKGYFGDPKATSEAFEDGWLRTGDLGELDEGGRLFVKGRKKDTIVTPEGLNVFPEDVEQVLNGLPGVRESAVVGSPAGGGERVHAVLVTEPGVDPEAIVRAANARLEDHKRVRGATVWPGRKLPRTAGTDKLKRSEVRGWLDGKREYAPLRAGDGLIASLLRRHAEGRDIRPETTLEDLGLSSLERVELLIALEARGNREIDEGRFATANTVADLEEIALGEDAGGTLPLDWAMPRWNRSLLAGFVRRISLATWILPLVRLIAPSRVEGIHHLDSTRGAVVLAANHQSHLDTPLILAALPRRLRYRVGVAMAKEFFDASFHRARYPRRRQMVSSLAYWLAALFFNAFPLPQREAGTRKSVRYIGELLEEGFSVLLFPEGRRTETGAILPFLPGIGMIGARLAVEVVPVRLEGVDRVLHRTWKVPRRGRVRIAFGSPLVLRGYDYAALSRQVEQAVRKL